MTAALLALLARRGAAQTGENVLVVANANDPASVEIADYYVRKRQIPSDQLLRIKVAATDEIARGAFETLVERPVADWLAIHSAQDRILYIVLTKGVPLRIAGTSGANGTIASVDSELTLLYRRLCGSAVPAAGPLKNPYFLNDERLVEAEPFSHRRQDLYLVTRLDGFTVADVKALIDRGSAPSQQGVILLDGRSEWKTSPGNSWLERAATRLKGMTGWSNRVVLDTSSTVLRDQSSVLGYYSWGSNDPAIASRHLHLQFMPGALAGMFVSSDGRTFQEPPDGWDLRGPDFAGSNQSLIGDLIRDGVTGVAGHVAEPYLNATIRPDILFPAYAAGFNLVESFYLAMPYVSWQTIVVGDPLCAPFREKRPGAKDIDPGLDPVTEVPGFLSERRTAAVVETGVKPAAAKLYLKAEARLARGDRAGARQALEAATSDDENLTDGHLLLAGLYEQDGNWDGAIDQYRRVLSRAPDQPVALNNLAYALALHHNAAAEALPLAKRAYSVSNGSPKIADTLGWIYHLLGNDAEAEPLTLTAAKAVIGDAEVHLHAAIVLAANGKMAEAARELEKAVTLEKALEDRQDVRDLRKRLNLSRR